MHIVTLFHTFGQELRQTKVELNLKLTQIVLVFVLINSIILWPV